MGQNIIFDDFWGRFLKKGHMCLKATISEINIGPTVRHIDTIHTTKNMKNFHFPPFYSHFLEKNPKKEKRYLFATYGFWKTFEQLF